MVASDRLHKLSSHNLDIAKMALFREYLIDALMAFNRLIMINNIDGVEPITYQPLSRDTHQQKFPTGNRVSREESICLAVVGMSRR